MPTPLTRRRFVQLAALSPLGFSLAVPASRAQGTVTLAELRKRGSIRVGLVNQPPYSSVTTSGEAGGFVPTLVEEIMKKLGVPKLDPIVGSYGQMVPGLQAGRWDMIGASFRITKARCSQVMFTDPVTFDGGAIAYVPSEVPTPPRGLKELAATKGMIGVLQGSYLVAMAEDNGVAKDRIAQFPDNNALIEGLLAKRATIVVSTNASLRRLRKLKNDAFDIVYPLPEDPPVGSGPAFNRSSPDLYDAFQKELRAMRASGELAKMTAKFGLTPAPASMGAVTAKEACARVM